MGQLHKSYWVQELQGGVTSFMGLQKSISTSFNIPLRMAIESWRWTFDARLKRLMKVVLVGLGTRLNLTLNGPRTTDTLCYKHLATGKPEPRAPRAEFKSWRHEMVSNRS